MLMKKTYSLPLFEHAHARTTDPATSHEAAASLPSERIRSSQAEVLGFFHLLGEMTDEDLCFQAVINHGSKQSPSGLRTRRSELTAAGRIIDTGKRAVTSHGRKAIVWGARR